LQFILFCDVFHFFFSENTFAKNPKDYYNENGQPARRIHSRMESHASSSSGGNSMRGIDLNQFLAVEIEEIDMNQFFSVDDLSIVLNQVPSVKDDGVGLNQFL